MKTRNKKQKQNILPRRNFLKAIIKKNNETTVTQIRPPYHKNKTDFIKCINCSDTPCIDICETNIIALSYYNTPYLNFNIGGCSFCEKCAEACQRGVLDTNNTPLINALVQINRDICLSWNNEECNNCENSCSVKAILFYNKKNPYIDTQSCTKCGFCFLSCPHKAINISKIE